MDLRSQRDFSGGWQFNVSRAATLFAPADIRISDEPTNHMNLEPVLWLESFIAISDKVVLLVSRERSFLNNVCNKILSIDEVDFASVGSGKNFRPLSRP
jgi:ATPase subunit of ABC transporter with duplicated ATPase domains